MSIKTRNEMFKIAAPAPKLCHCTYGINTSETTSKRLCKTTHTPKCYLTWSHGVKSSKVIMDVPAGSQTIITIPANASQDTIDTAFMDLFATQHDHWAE